MRESLSDYRIWLLRSSDYMGESSRHWPRMRHVVDAAMRTAAPWHGSLFSWLVSKPDTHAKETA